LDEMKTASHELGLSQRLYAFSRLVHRVGPSGSASRTAFCEAARKQRTAARRGAARRGRLGGSSPTAAKRREGLRPPTRLWRARGAKGGLPAGAGPGQGAGPGALLWTAGCVGLRAESRFLPQPEACPGGRHRSASACVGRRRRGSPARSASVVVAWAVSQPFLSLGFLGCDGTVRIPGQLRTVGGRSRDPGEGYVGIAKGCFPTPCPRRRGKGHSHIAGFPAPLLHSRKPGTFFLSFPDAGEWTRGPGAC
jgi:hypothetical protein